MNEKLAGNLRCAEPATPITSEAIARSLQLTDGEESAPLSRRTFAT